MRGSILLMIGVAVLIIAIAGFFFMNTSVAIGMIG